jgi:hypothetical protein
MPGARRLVRLLRWCGWCRTTRRQRHGLPEQLFDRAQLLAVFGGHEAGRPPRRVHARRAPDPVDVVLRAVRQVEVDHVADVRHVDAAGRNIGCHENSECPALESFQRRSPLRQAPVPVNHGHLVPGASQNTAELVGPMLRPGKDEHGVLVLSQQRHQETGLAIVGGVMHRLGHAARRRGRAGDHDLDRILHAGAGQLIQIGRQSSGEQKRLPFLRHGFQNLVDLGGKPHVKHAVCLIQHEDLHRRQVDRAVPHVVQQPSRRGHENVRPLAKAAHLRLHIGAPDNRRGKDTHAATELIDDALDLDGQLTGRHQNQRAWLAFRHGRQPLDHGNHKRGGLAGAGLRASQHVTSLERMRNGLRLNGRGVKKACLGQVPQEGFGYTKSVERTRSSLHKTILSLWIALKRDQRTEGRQNQEGIRSGLDLIAMRSRSPLWLSIITAGLLR